MTTVRRRSVRPWAALGLPPTPLNGSKRRTTTPRRRSLHPWAILSLPAALHNGSERRTTTVRRRSVRPWAALGLPPTPHNASKRRTTTPRRRSLRPWAALGLLAVLLTGCGIRSTQVPTDFGPAPSRAPCAVSGDISTQTSGGVPVQVFLLCSAQLVTVDRSVGIPAGTAEGARRVLVAQGLLDELAETPSTAELQAGYATDVRGGMTVSGPQDKDPEDTLRLSTPPDEITRFALAQIVCTLANSAAAQDDGTVILGGPDATPLNRYECTTEVRTSPGTESPPSTRVGD